MTLGNRQEGSNRLHKDEREKIHAPNLAPVSLPLAKDISRIGCFSMQVLVDHQGQFTTVPIGWPGKGFCMLQRNTGLVGRGHSSQSSTPIFKAVAVSLAMAKDPACLCFPGSQSCKQNPWTVARKGCSHASKKADISKTCWEF